MAGLISAATLYIAAQAMLQYATGHNLFGEPRAPDGTLTGPFGKERAGPPFSRLLFPAVLPPAWRLVSRPGLGGKLAAAVLVLATVTVQVLFGQRMPVLLTGLGLLVSALLLPRLRALALGAGVAVLVLVAASAAIDRPAFVRLVIQFSHQMATFPRTEYGLIAARAVAMVRASPVTGLGFDAFRFACADPRFFHGWYGGAGGGAAMCVQHPHSHYLQAAVEAGLPGLALFCAMILAWLMAVGRGLWRTPDPLRVGLFVAVLIQEWPIASASDFVDMPLGGWFFLLLGFGLACARAAPPVAAARPAPYIAAETSNAER
jgi:O-antigen ligase